VTTSSASCFICEDLDSSKNEGLCTSEVIGVPRDSSEPNLKTSLSAHTFLLRTALRLIGSSLRSSSRLASHLYRQKYVDVCSATSVTLFPVSRISASLFLLKTFLLHVLQMLFGLCGQLLFNSNMLLVTRQLTRMLLLLLRNCAELLLQSKGWWSYFFEAIYTCFDGQHMFS
jgi:hypothetical protein